MAHSLDVSRVQEVLDAVGANTDRLTKWELEFHESVSDQYDRNGFLTDGQLEKLEEIYVKLP